MTFHKCIFNKTDEVNKLFNVYLRNYLIITEPNASVSSISIFFNS